ncbi:MAG: hypothetical protein JXB00_15410 [Bacteroidales bacterium]|nr:hypothetical protein [Bacteroidales bacterium]
MKSVNLKVLFTLFIIATISMSSVNAQKPRWELLGMRKVDFKLDRDVIPVTWREGAFNAVRIVVRQGQLNMHKCVIHFENGGTKEVELRHNFAGRSASRLIDLPGNKRLIEKIEFWYDTKNMAGRKATVMVYGRH